LPLLDFLIRCHAIDSCLLQKKKPRPFAKKTYHALQRCTQLPNARPSQLHCWLTTSVSHCIDRAHSSREPRQKRIWELCFAWDCTSQKTLSSAHMNMNTLVYTHHAPTVAICHTEHEGMPCACLCCKKNKYSLAGTRPRRQETSLGRWRAWVYGMLMWPCA
jgi:hypothetical protein